MRVPEAAASAVLELARARGMTGNELPVLLAGPLCEADALVDRLVIPRHEAHSSSLGCGLVIDGGCLNRVGAAMRSEGRHIHALLHSHPCRAYHSPTDDATPLMRYHGAISLVIPDFGGRAQLLDGAAGFQFDYYAGWREHPVQELVIVDGDEDFEVLVDE